MGGQYLFTLRRDVLADYWYDIRNAPIFVQKGMLPTSDTFIYNNQQGSFNQIQVSRTELWDQSGCGWLVAYMPQDAFENKQESTQQTTSKTISLPIAQETPGLTYDQTLASFQAEFPNLIGKWVFNQQHFKLSTQALIADTGPFGGDGRWQVSTALTGTQYYTTLAEKSGSSSSYICTFEASQPSDISSYVRKEVVRLAASQRLMNNTGLTFENNFYAARASSGYIYDTELWRQIGQLRGRVLYNQSTGEYLRVDVSEAQAAPKGKVSLRNADLEQGVKQALIYGYKLAFDDVSWEAGIPFQGTTVLVKGTPSPYYQPTLDNIQVDYGTGGFKVTVSTLASPQELSLTIPEVQARVHCQDQPYDIMCIPFYQRQAPGGARGQWDQETGQISYISDIYAMRLMQSLSVALGQNNVYDVQLLPYCPLQLTRYHTTQNGQLVIKCGTALGDIKITLGDQTVGWACWARQASSIFNIQKDIEVPTQALELKQVACTDFVRLAAPNFSTFFDFNPAKNLGLSKLFVSQQCKPFNPWIRVTPEWNPGGLYQRQSSFYDAAGLILGGDMSIAQPTSAWANYQLNNKNYLNIFDRQMQKLEFEQGWGLAGSITSAIGGTVGGAALGAKMGGPVGAVAGTALGAVGGIVDIAKTASFQNQAIDYTKDLFEYQLGNIKALPQGLARTAAQAPNNTVVPTLEYWSTTPAQKEALINKITFNGMTVQRIDTMANFQPQGGYFKGQLIRLPASFNGSTHVAGQIANELYKGVYLE